MEGYMKFETEFRNNLTTKYVSDRTGTHYTPKAAGDQLSRCRRLENHFGMELGPSTVFPAAKTAEMIRQIKKDGTALGSTKTLPYGYLHLIRALRLYQMFLVHRRN